MLVCVRERARKRERSLKKRDVPDYKSYSYISLFNMNQSVKNVMTKVFYQ